MLTAAVVVTGIIFLILLWGSAFSGFPKEDRRSLLITGAVLFCFLAARGDIKPAPRPVVHHCECAQGETN